jgi:hypothetical protein
MFGLLKVYNFYLKYVWLCQFWDWRCVANVAAFWGVTFCNTEVAGLSSMAAFCGILSKFTCLLRTISSTSFDRIFFFFISVPL